MANITANSIPIVSGGNEWTITDWMNWHKALVRKYNTVSMLIKSGNYTLAINPSASVIFNQQYAKTSVFSKARNQLSNPFAYKNEKKYFGMWSGTHPFKVVSIQNYDPVFTGLTIAGDVAEGVADAARKIYLITKWSLIIGVPVIVITGVAIFYSKVKGNKQKIIIQK